MKQQLFAIVPASKSITRSICLIAVLVAQLFATSPANAEMYYKWQEANGNWTYGAHPPPNVKAYEVKTTSVNVRKPDVESESDAAPATPKLSEADAKRHALYCETAKANLEALSSDAVIHRRDENGEIVPVSEEEKQAERENAEQAIERYCHPAA